MGSSFKKKLYEIPKSLKKKKCHSKNRKNWGRGVDPPTHHPEGFWDSALEKRHCGAVPFLESVRSGCKKKLFLKQRRSGTNKRPCSFFFIRLCKGTYVCVCAVCSGCHHMTGIGCQLFYSRLPCTERIRAVAGTAEAFSTTSRRAMAMGLGRPQSLTPAMPRVQ